MKRYIYLRAEFLPETSSVAQIDLVKQTLKTNKIPVFIEDLSESKQKFLEESGFALLSYNSILSFDWSKPAVVNQDLSWWTTPPLFPNADYLIQTADGDILLRGPGYRTVDLSAADVRYLSLRVAGGVFRAPLEISDSFPEIDYNGDKIGLFYLYLAPNNSQWRGYAGQIFVSSTAPTLANGLYSLSTIDSLGALCIGVVSLYHEITHDSADKKIIFDLFPPVSSSLIVPTPAKDNLGFEGSSLLYRDSPIVFSFPVNAAHHPRTHGFTPGVYKIYYIQGDIFQTGKTGQIFLYAMEPTNQSDGTISWTQLKPDLVYNEYRAKDLRGAVLVGVCNARYGSLVSEEDIYPIVTELLEGTNLVIEYDGSLSYSDDSVFRTINATEVFCAHLHWSSEGTTGLPLSYDVETNELSTQVFFDEGIYSVYITSSDPNWIYLDDLYAADLIISKYALPVGQSFFPTINHGRVGLFCVGSVKISYRYDDPYGAEFPDPKGYIVPYHKNMPLRVESFDTDQTFYYQGGILVVATMALPTTLIDYPIYLKTDATIIYPQYTWTILIEAAIVDSSYDLDSHIQDQSLDIPVDSFGDVQSWTYTFGSEKQSYNISDEFGHIGGKQAKRGDSVICRVTIDALDAAALKQELKVESWTLLDTNNNPPRVQRMGASCYYKNKIYYMFGYVGQGGDYPGPSYESYGYMTSFITTFDIVRKLWETEISYIGPWSPGIAYCTGITLDDYLYAIGGNNHIIQYDPVQQTFRSSWSNFVKSASCTDGDNFYCFSGEAFYSGGYEYFTTGYEIIGIGAGGLSFTPTAYAGFPTGRKYATAQYLDGHCYIFGGATDSASTIGSAEMDIFDVASHTWLSGRTGLSAMVRPSSVLYDGKIYCMGNTEVSKPTGEYSKSLYVYDIASDSWSTGLESLIGRVDPMMVLVEDQIYIWGGVEAIRNLADGTYSNHYCDKIEVYQIPTRSPSGIKIDPKSHYPVIRDIGIVFSRYKLVPLYELTTTTTTSSTTTTTITTSTLTTTQTSSTTTTITTKSTQTLTSGFTTGTEMPTPWTRGIPGGYRRSGATAFVYDDKFYIWGGVGVSNTCYNSFDIFDFQTNTWTLQQFAGGTARMGHVSVVHNNKLYITCGWDFLSNMSLLTTDIFDFQTHTWSTGAPTPILRRQASATVIASQNKLYVLGGESVRKRVSIYDIATNSWDLTWSSGVSLGSDYDTVIWPGLTAYGNDLYVVGGLFGSVALDKFLVIDTTTKTVTVKNFTIQTARTQPMVVLYEGCLLLLKGWVGNFSITQNTVASYKLSADQWQLDGSGGSTTGDRFIGGLYQNKVYCWATSTGNMEIYDAERAAF